MDIDSTLSYLFHSFHILALEYGAADSHGGDGRRDSNGGGGDGC